MITEPAAVVLAAGAGTRLRPLTTVRPKALCPVNNVPLVDHAIARARRRTGAVAVNVHHGRDQLVRHLDGRVHLSIEEPEALGTAGALGALREWIDGRDVLVLNADAWHRDDITRLFEGWDRVRARLLVVRDAARGDFGDLRYAGAALLPWRWVRDLRPVFSGLYEECFRPLREQGLLDLVESSERFFDCGTPADYHAANMTASGGASVVGEGATIEGAIRRCVIWPGVVVARGERLSGAIRARDDITLQIEPADCPCE